MVARKWWWSGVCAGVLALFGLGAALTQDAQPPAGMGGQRRSPEEIRQRNLDRIKESLKATEEEWKALQPGLDKILTLSTALRPAGMRMRQEAPEGTAAPQIDLAKAAQDLRTTLSNKDAAAEEIGAKLAAYREAREKVKQEMAEAQEALCQNLTKRQEAQLVLGGTID
ncbi:MAG: hypothetical protein V1918_09535 [Planctomycetota bacterium]